MTDKRHLSTIAKEISADWRNPYFGARPYIQAMYQLQTMSDKYGMDTAEDIVLRFLANAGTWKGEVARRVKAELKKMLKEEK